MSFVNLFCEKLSIYCTNFSSNISG